jgi:predicted double-glycine peptidase
MNPWVESLAVLMFAAGGLFTGAWFSRLPKPWWLLGYFLPLTLVVLLDIANRNPAVTFWPLLYRLMLGHNRFAAHAFIATVMLTTPMSKLPKRRDRVAMTVLMTSFVLGMSFWPVLAPAFNQKQLAAIITNIDSDGVCHQSTDYTCGPAAAVTALHKIGLPADEGELAILAHSTAASGTPPDVLAETLQNCYAKEGLVCEYRVFKNVAELKDRCPVLAIVKFNLILDHYVTVLNVNDRAVTVGDPLQGLETLSIADFQDKWRFVGVVVRRN